MTQQKMKDALLTCTDIAKDIMLKISDELKEKEINFSHKNQAEIIVDGKNKDDIVSVIENSNTVDKTQMKLLLQVSESNNKVFVRQKFNK